MAIDALTAVMLLHRVEFGERWFSTPEISLLICVPVSKICRKSTYTAKYLRIYRANPYEISELVVLWVVERINLTLCFEVIQGTLRW